MYVTIIKAKLFFVDDKKKLVFVRFWILYCVLITKCT